MSSSGSSMNRICESTYRYSSLSRLVTHRRPRSLLTISPEVGCLFAYCWSHSKLYPSEHNLMDIVTHIANPKTRGLWDDGLKRLMNEVTDAQAAVSMCTWSMRKGIVNKPLLAVLIAMGRFIQNCSDVVFLELQDAWIRFLLCLERACERQLCSGDEEICQSEIIPRALGLVQYVHRRFPATIN